MFSAKLLYHSFQKAICAFVVLSLVNGPFIKSIRADCPQLIGYMQGHALVEHKIIPQFKEIYQQVGCSPAFIPLPGRRSIASFNAGWTDGEAVRLEIIEEQFQRPFVRSEVPVFSLEAALWGQSKGSQKDIQTIGYILGVYWMEAYAKKNAKMRRFMTFADMMKSYNTGSIDAFLAMRSEVVYAQEKDLLKKPVTKVQTHMKTPSYHYLAKDYEAVMQKFSQILRKGRTQNEAPAAAE